MAEEGLFGGLGQSEGAEDTAGGDLAATGLDASAAAVALGGSKDHPGLAAKTGIYFDHQARLVAIQTEHLHEQREVLLSQLKLRRLSERLKVGSQIFWILIATVFGTYLAIMLHDALFSRAVIVEPFDAPPALAARGLTGKVVAGALLDQLVRLQSAARSTAVKRDLSNSWTDDIKVEVPETGLSVGDIQRLLRQRLGHDLHIGGDLVQSDSGGLTLTVRGDGVLPKAFAGGAADLDRLVMQAGEYVYGQTQPALLAVYLTRAGRNAEAIRFSKAAVLTAPIAERPFILNAWATALISVGGSLQQSLALDRAALAQKPDYWAAYTNLALTEGLLGDEEAAWRAGDAMRRAAGGRPGRAPEIAYSSYDWLTFNLLAARAAVLDDAEQHGGVGSTSTAADPVVAGADMELHDFDDASLRLQRFDGADAYAAAMTHYVRGRMAQDAGDAATAAREMEAYGAANADPAVSGGDTSYHCAVAQAEEAAGHPDRADAEVKAGGHFVDCLRFRADGLDRRGDWAGALRGYAAAVALAPDLPAAYYSWGLALLRHGDAAGAVEKFSAANARGPHWADPLKSWGDVLARQGKWSAAMKKYAAALGYAPAWAELKQARDAAAAHGG